MEISLKNSTGVVVTDGKFKRLLGVGIRITLM